ncbi:HlyD family type I secretion periplasmic adaptor subunit [Methylobacterium sp. BTF04]|uniref:HlyD family type I secretion periplasmic adaptor subunit n=1 Tax=Methylobacterium sp. BTF04 TaxID=2708300 RepID=UPI0013D48F85|nr:HlyD family type I secretion periplasmic adaptor subunit [Methylobacterium sp. BTF04]NEU13476.1 HlyD family type I secretion periplasmic adaptor subunit [Methylobacterium sp. BTF04]
MATALDGPGRGAGPALDERPAQVWAVGVSHDTRWLTTFGFSFLGVMIVGFGVWAGSAPLAGAIVTSGSFVTTGQNKTLQHLEGGVIREILVKEGDVVEPGQVLLVLDDTTPKVELRRLTLRHDRLSAVETRLRAEGLEASEITFPPELLAKASDPDVSSVIAHQTLTFQARRKSLDSDVAILRDGITALDQKIKGTRVQRDAMTRQIKLFEQELEGKMALLNAGLVRRSEVLALQRAHANALGEIGRLDGDIGDAQERITRIREQIQGARNTAVKTVTEQLHETLAEQNDVRERIRSAQGVLGRIAVTAPVAGIVVKLRYHTAGGVVEAGKSIMEIVPSQGDLVIEAHVRPQDIDHVRRGQSAGVRLTALSQRITPMVGGQVIYVSADALPDDRRGSAGSGDTYIARIRLDPIEAASLRHFSPTPGMPAEVYIKTTERTFLEYLIKPLKDSMTRAFREL